MKHLLYSAATFAVFLLSGRSVVAQNDAAAHRGGILAAGVEYSNANSDYEPKRISGVSAYATYDLTAHLGMEADVQLLQFGTPNDFAERTYMVGPRYVYRKQRYEPYAKALVGFGQAVAQASYVHDQFIPSSNFTFAFGGGLDIRIPKKLTVRAIDFEYQDWPNFGTTYGNGLNPTVLSFGIAYRIR